MSVSSLRLVHGKRNHHWLWHIKYSLNVAFEQDLILIMMMLLFRYLQFLYLYFHLKMFLFLYLLSLCFHYHLKLREMIFLFPYYNLGIREFRFFHYHLDLRETLFPPCPLYLLKIREWFPYLHRLREINLICYLKMNTTMMMITYAVQNNGGSQSWDLLLLIRLFNQVKKKTLSIRHLYRAAHNNWLSPTLIDHIKLIKTHSVNNNFAGLQ